MHAKVKKLHDELNEYFEKFSAHYISDRTGYSLHYVQQLKNRTTRIKSLIGVMKWLHELRRL